MTVVGIAYALNKNNERVATLHVTDSFDEYDKNTELGRSCLGQKVDTVYVGTYDVSNIKVGAMIDISYDRAIQTKNGVFQPIKRIEVVK
ncbi:MAG: hypothetical protein IJ171_08640 [Ruminococcus sp.]|nr:hypothetical protein [Ruminococcus sp.]